jgi:hypothetical protein
MAMVASGVRLKSNSQAIASHKKVRTVKGPLEADFATKKKRY